MAGSKAGGTQSAATRAAQQRHALFILELIINGGNATEAAKAVGYSAKTAGAQGHRLLKDAEIQKKFELAVSRLLADREVKASFVLERLKWLADSNVKKACKWDKDGLVIKDSSELDEGVAYCIDSIQQIPTKRGPVIKFKMRKPDNALEMLGRYFRLFENTPPPPDDELKKALARLDDEEGALRGAQASGVREGGNLRASLDPKSIAKATPPAYGAQPSGNESPASELSAQADASEKSPPRGAVVDGSEDD